MTDLSDGTLQGKPESSESTRGRIRYRQSPPPVAYANIFEVQAGAEEVVVTLGYGKAGRVPGGSDARGAGNEIVIDPSYRVALTPQAAKRLAIALGQGVNLVEARRAAVKPESDSDSGSPSEPSASPSEPQLAETQA